MDHLCGPTNLPAKRPSRSRNTAVGRARTDILPAASPCSSSRILRVRPSFAAKRLSPVALSLTATATNLTGPLAVSR